MPSDPSKTVLITGILRFADGRERQPMDASGGPPGEAAPAPADIPKLYEYPGLSIAVRTGTGTSSNHRAVVTEDGRFGFQIPVPADRDALEQVRFTAEGCRTVELDGTPIGSGGPTGHVADVGPVRMEPA